MTDASPVILAATQAQAIAAAVAAGHNPHNCTIFATDETRKALGLYLASWQRADDVISVDGWEHGRYAAHIAAKLRGRGLLKR